MSQDVPGIRIMEEGRMDYCRFHTLSDHHALVHADAILCPHLVFSCDDENYCAEGPMAELHEVSSRFMMSQSSSISWYSTCQPSTSFSGSELCPAATDRPLDDFQRSRNCVPHQISHFLLRFPITLLRLRLCHSFRCCVLATAAFTT